jgi:hypothetical protein
MLTASTHVYILLTKAATGNPWTKGMAMTISRLQTLAQRAVYEPSRGMENSPEMKMVRTGILELAIRFVPGCRTFAAIAEDGVVTHLGIMEPGGDEDAMLDELERRVVEGYTVRLLKAL